MRKIVAATLLVAAGLMVSAFDDTPPDAASKKTDDPNKMICEKQEVIGSRLATHKVCATRAEWEERRMQDRMAIEQGQRLGIATKGH